MKRSAVLILMLLQVACAQSESARKLLPLRNTDPLRESLGESQNPRLILRVENHNLGSGDRWSISASLSNSSIASSKKLSEDFGSEIQIAWGSITEPMSLSADQQSYELENLPISAANITSLLRTNVELTSSSNILLSRSLSLQSRTLTDPLNPGSPEDYDFDNCFSFGQAPTITWLPLTTGSLMQLEFIRQDDVGEALYDNLNDSLGRWNLGISNRDVFQKLFSSEERTGDPEEEIIANVIRSLKRSQSLGKLSLLSSPQVQADVVLIVHDTREIFVSFLGECEP